MDARRGNRGENRPSRGSPVSGAELAGIGAQFALTILVFVYAGIWLDRRLGTSPWLLLTCVFLGAGGGIYSMYRRVTASQRDAKHKQS
jgi:F0F1-type ATP synthase assembly protein I